MNPCRKGTLLLIAAHTLALLWGLMVVYALIAPDYSVRGTAVEATIALLDHHVNYLGHSIRIPALDSLRIQLVPVLMAAVFSIASSLYSLADLASKRRPTLISMSSALLSALMALVSAGPLLGADRVAEAVARALTQGTRYPVNAGYIDLGTAEIHTCPAHSIIAGLHGAAAWVAIALIVLAAAADTEAETCAPTLNLGARHVGYPLR